MGNLAACVWIERINKGGGCPRQIPWDTKEALTAWNLSRCFRDLLPPRWGSYSSVDFSGRNRTDPTIEMSPRSFIKAWAASTNNPTLIDLMFT
jgi:hypothetical protein